MDILILFRNKNFLSIFRLEIWWDVVRHPNTPYLQVWWWWLVPTGRNVAWTSKYPRNPRFSPLWPPTKQNFNFFYHYFAGNVFTNIFLCRKYVSNVFGLVSVACWMDATKFCSLREKRIFLWNDVTMTSEIGATTSKCAGQSYGSADTFSDSLAQSFQKLWSIIASCAEILVQAGLTGWHIHVSKLRMLYTACWIQR